MVAPIGYPEQFGTLLRRDPVEGPIIGKGPPVHGPAGPVVETPMLKPTDAVSGVGEAPAITNVPGPTFADHLKGFVSGIDQTQKSAEYKAEEFAVGHHNDIHGTMIAVEQAEISLHLLANVRNRVVDLYREVMRMGS